MVLGWKQAPRDRRLGAQRGFERPGFSGTWGNQKWGTVDLIFPAQLMGEQECGAGLGPGTLMGLICSTWLRHRPEQGLKEGAAGPAPSCNGLSCSLGQRMPGGLC